MANDLDRKFALLNFLSSCQQAPTYKEIYNHLSDYYSNDERKSAATEKMFTRDKNDLSEEGFVVVAEAGEDGQERYSIPKHQAWLKNFQMNRIWAKSLREAIEDRAISGQMMTQGLFALKKLLAFSAPFDEILQGEQNENPEEISHFMKAHEALLARKVLKIAYPNHRGIPEERFFSPYAIFFRYGKTFLIVGCHRTKTPKVIALDRIKSIFISKNLKEKFIPQPSDFDADRYIRTGRYDYDSSLGTVVRFRLNAGEMGRVLEKNPQMVVSSEQDGSVLCEYFVTSEEAFFSWMLSFGANNEILSPPDFRLKFKKLIEKAIP